MRITQSSIRLRRGESVELECEVSPINAPTNTLKWELDNKTIASINPTKDGKRCRITAASSYEGKGNVRCYDATANVGAICNIQVINKVPANGFGKAALGTLIAGIFLPYLLPVSIIASALGLFVDEEPDHKLRYIGCLIGSIVILLFWIIAAN